MYSSSVTPSGRPKPAKPRLRSNARIDSAMSRKSRTRNTSLASRVELPRQHAGGSPATCASRRSRRASGWTCVRASVVYQSSIGALAEGRQAARRGRRRTSPPAAAARTPGRRGTGCCRPTRGRCWKSSGCADSTRFAGSDSTRSMCSQYVAGADSYGKRRNTTTSGCAASSCISHVLPLRPRVVTISGRSVGRVARAKRLPRAG